MVIIRCILCLLPFVYQRWILTQLWCIEYQWKSKLHDVSLIICTYGISFYMMTSSNGNIFRASGHLCGEFTGDRWISRTKASDAELWCFVFFICARINGWVNNRETGDLRRHRFRYDVIVMIFFQCRILVTGCYGRSVTTSVWPSMAWNNVSVILVTDMSKTPPLSVRVSGSGLSTHSHWYGTYFVDGI